MNVALQTVADAIHAISPALRRKHPVSCGLRGVRGQGSPSEGRRERAAKGHSLVVGGEGQEVVGAHTHGAV